MVGIWVGGLVVLLAVAYVVSSLADRRGSLILWRIGYRFFPILLATWFCLGLIASLVVASAVPISP